MKSSLKTSMFILCAALSNVASAGCTVNNVMFESVRENLSRRGGIPISDAQCAVLNKRNLRLSIDSDYGVLKNVAYGWVVASLKDDNGFESRAKGLSTYINSAQPDTPTAEAIAYAAAEDAIKTLDFEKAASEILEMQKKTLKKGK